MKFIRELCGGSHKEPKESKTTTYRLEAMWINWVTVIKCIWQGRITKLAKLIQVHIIQNKRAANRKPSAHPASTCLTANQVFASCYKTYLVVETVLDNKADPPPPPV